MIFSVIICLLTCILMLVGVLKFPRISLWLLRVDSYWFITLIGASVVILTGQRDTSHIWDALTADTAINPLKILTLFISMTMLSIFLDEMGFVCDDDEKIVPSVDSLLTDGMTVAVRPKVEAMSAMDFGLDLSQAKRVITCEATAYTSAADECGKSDGITASGMMFEVGVVAVDRRQIPLGTKLYIESLDGKYVYGYCIAADTGGAIKGNKVDLAMNTKSECFQFGRRQVRVYIF
jgi:3D (Asp-Asp-Asp) domain-containing protein